MTPPQNQTHQTRPNRTEKCSARAFSFKKKSFYSLSKRLKIGYFGSISHSKGINTIIKLSKIDKDNDYFIFGGLKSEITKLKKKNFNKNLYFNENIPYINLPKVMLKMDILTIPYTNQIRSAGEVDEISKFTSPLKLFDYLAVGKIIMSSDLNVLREVIDSKNAIFIKNFENIYAWKQSINFAKNNKNKIYIMSKNNLKLSKEYDHSSKFKKYINF